MNDYEKQAEDFLSETATEFDIKFLYCGPYFDDDKQHRDVYVFTLSNARGVYDAKFGDSVHNTERRQLAATARGGYGSHVRQAQRLGFKQDTNGAMSLQDLRAARQRKPSAYDVLSCLTKYCPISFAEFCAAFGYSEDSRAAEKTHRACLEEAAGLRRIFTTEQLDRLAEIN